MLDRVKRLREVLDLPGQKVWASTCVDIATGPHDRAPFKKYETGDYLPSRAISSALTLLDHDSRSLDVLRARRMTPARHLEQAPFP